MPNDPQPTLTEEQREMMLALTREEIAAWKIRDPESFRLNMDAFARGSEGQ